MLFRNKPVKMNPQPQAKKVAILISSTAEKGNMFTEVEFAGTNYIEELGMVEGLLKAVSERRQVEMTEIVQLISIKNMLFE